MHSTYTCIFICADTHINVYTVCSLCSYKELESKREKQCKERDKLDLIEIQGITFYEALILQT